jgi:hypothetical protein
MTTTSVAERFMHLFAGSQNSYGTYDLNRQVKREDGKISGTAVTRRAKVTLDLLESHLNGTGTGLGIVPINEKNECVFGVVDVDEYQGLNLQEIAVKLKRSKLPLIVCRSKSGGAHIYVFSKAPVPASKMKAKLVEVASFIGHGDAEIFPKQAQLLNDRGDLGSWINLPYFGGIRGMRYAINASGDAMTPEEFLDLAEKTAVDDDWFSQKIVNEEEFPGGPPCLQVLAQQGFPEGTRNDGLLNIGVYLKKVKPDSWEQELESYNHRLMVPPLTLTEVQGVIKSLKRKDYTYACTRAPCAQHCSAALCRTRPHGVGSSTNGRFPILGGLTKLNTKPPIWFWTVDDVRMELATAELQDPRSFQRRAMEYLNVMPPVPSNAVWQAAVQHALTSVTVIDAPADSSQEGQFWEMVEKFCTGRAQALTRDEIALGKPFTEENRTYFRMADLSGFLARNKFFEFKTTKISSMLRDVGAQHHAFNLRGRTVNCWSIVAYAEQKDPLAVPSSVSDDKGAF